MRHSVLIVLTLAAASTAVAASGDGPGAHHVAFITSRTGGPVLGDITQWPENQGLTGVAAADAICQTVAADANLANPTLFRAWISDSTDDAYCRIQGYGGHVSDNCGQPTLPVGAGPWVRVDGLPWAEKLEQIVGFEGVVYRPLLNELGDDYADGSSGEYSWTGTFPEGGAMSGGTCSDWTGLSGAAGLGLPGRTATGTWGFNQGGTCADIPPRSLLCLETGEGPPLPPEHSAGRLAFVSSAYGSGDLGSWPLLAGFPGAPTGLDAGDAICRTLAAAAFLPYPDSFKAWLSTSTVDARDRFVHDGPWIRLDGVPFADDLADLTDDGPAVPLSVDETGGYHYSVGMTGTLLDGTGSAYTCGDWTDAGAMGEIGYSNGAWSWWSDYTHLGCSGTSNHVYCLSDAPDELLFWSSFESGDLGRWSAVNPGAQ